MLIEAMNRVVYDYDVISSQGLQNLISFQSSWKGPSFCTCTVCTISSDLHRLDPSCSVSHLHLFLFKNNFQFEIQTQYILK